MVKIKNILNDIIDITYTTDSTKIALYKKFYVEFIDKVMRGRHGDYFPLTHHIRIFNLYRDDNSIVATTIHELAHHIDYIDRGTTDHSKNFYAVFNVLLYSALNMNLFSKEQFLGATRDASDSNKIAKMITDYIPLNINYKANLKTIEVFNSYTIKDKLKENGYKFNSVNTTWEKEVQEEFLDADVNFLKTLSAEYNIKDSTDLSFTKKLYIIAGKGSFDVRDILKENGFIYNKADKNWRKEVTKESLETSLCYFKNLLPDVVFE